eukprot:GHVS01073794.1.p1 GENE.GHVS01073794.1~~GHVS01073794.1.p1  ORF type:complete len:458 (+),score=54.71 GHVS01073794.1:1156-2529(+)
MGEPFPSGGDKHSSVLFNMDANDFKGPLSAFVEKFEKQIKSLTTDVTLMSSQESLTKGAVVNFSSRSSHREVLIAPVKHSSGVFTLRVPHDMKDDLQVATVATEKEVIKWENVQPDTVFETLKLGLRMIYSLPFTAGDEDGMSSVSLERGWGRFLEEDFFKARVVVSSYEARIVFAAVPLSSVASKSNEVDDIVDDDVDDDADGSTPIVVGLSKHSDEVDGSKLSDEVVVSAPTDQVATRLQLFGERFMTMASDPWTLIRQNDVSYSKLGYSAYMKCIMISENKNLDGDDTLDTMLDVYGRGWPLHHTEETLFTVPEATMWPREEPFKTLLWDKFQAVTTVVTIMEIAGDEKIISNMLKNVEKGARGIVLHNKKRFAVRFVKGFNKNELEFRVPSTIIQTGKVMLEGKTINFLLDVKKSNTVDFCQIQIEEPGPPWWLIRWYRTVMTAWQSWLNFTP